MLRLSSLLLILLLPLAVSAQENRDAVEAAKEIITKSTKIHPLLDVKGPYEPTWESLSKHKAPQWFMDCKIGFSMHWGPYAVPAWAGKGASIGASSYSEWYWQQMNKPKSATAKHHAKEWSGYVYDDFIPMFKAENFDADEWMKGLKENGVKYFYITSKHHDGFCLWDTKYSDRNSAKMGPKRDILQELVTAARKQDIKIGFYYSLFEWYNPSYVKELEKDTWLGSPQKQKEYVKTLAYTGHKPAKSYVDDYMIPQIVELIDRFHPDYFCFDGEWDHPEGYWKMKQVAAYFYNQAAKRGQEVLMNDRFGIGTRGKRGDFFHVEYHAKVDKTKPWAMWRGFGKSFGHNKNEDRSAFLTPKQVIEMVVNCVSENGNIEFNVGPTADGRIDQPEWSLIQSMGNWLKLNGEAIYDAKGAPKEKTDHYRVTKKPKKKKTYYHIFQWPKDGKLLIKDFPNEVKNVYLLSSKKPIEQQQTSEGVLLTLPKHQLDIYVPVVTIEYKNKKFL
ncbi:MAG: alpha-L-fucosidase [Cytophagales bacterium]|nr:alpha-L-fucosidase [Cytophagales bacterium]